jgi:CHASE1-domain containing sensor protein
MTAARRGSAPSLASGRIALPLAVLGIGVALSILVFVLFRAAIETKANLRFQREASDAKHLIERRILSYVEIIHGLRVLFATRESVGREEFHRYVSALDLARTFPGFELLNYAANIPAANAGDSKRRFAATPASSRRATATSPSNHPARAARSICASGSTTRVPSTAGWRPLS